MLKTLILVSTADDFKIPTKEPERGDFFTRIKTAVKELTSDCHSIVIFEKKEYSGDTKKMADFITELGHYRSASYREIGEKTLEEMVQYFGQKFGTTFVVSSDRKKLDRVVETCKEFHSKFLLD